MLTRIKADQLDCRKRAKKDPDAKIRAGVLTTLIGELETASKKSGKELTDPQIVAVIKKFIKNIDETSAELEKSINSGSGSIVNTILQLDTELAALEHHLPDQLTETQVKDIVTAMIESNDNVNMGSIMKELKTNYEGQYDGRMASTIVKEALK